MNSAVDSAGSTGQPRLRRFFRRHVDPWLLTLLALVCIIGLLALFSASGESVRAVEDQAERLALGFGVMLTLAQITPEALRFAAPWLYGFSFALLAAVLVLGHHSQGAERWLVFGGLRFEPSELMKLAMPLMIAWFLHERALPPRALTTLAASLLILIPVAMIAIQPDLGTATLVLVAGALVLFLGGLRVRWLVGALVAVGAVAPLLWAHLHGYQRERLTIFLNPGLDPLGAGYHITQSKIAVGSGGLFGEGWLKGTQAKLDFLPEARTDFIFAVYGEEMGLVGALILLLLYTIIVARGFLIALRGQDTFQRLLAGSISMTFLVYVVINVGMVIGLLPVVGIPLPLVSYGGTSAVTLLAGFGMLMSVDTHRKLLVS